MRCPWCQEEASKVIDSRDSGGGEAIRRRRECLDCGRRYTTYERVEEAPLKVVKKDGRRQPFAREKLFSCVELSCQKLPLETIRLEALVDRIVSEVQEEHEREVPSSFIGERIMAHLRDLHPIAYVRYASIYRTFREPQDFLNELRPLLE